MDLIAVDAKIQANQFLNETTTQLEKDFLTVGINFDITKPVKNYTQLFSFTAYLVNALNEQDPKRIINLLYRIDLSEEKEPQIFHAIKYGAILENIGFFDGTSTPNYEDVTITQNTRVSYPIHHIDNIVVPSVGKAPKNIFFLTCDAFGVLPPISKLTPGQAAFHFISGYTAKVAGTEIGITEPQATFSTCFGAPFMPRHPSVYADLLSSKIRDHDANCWLINTGWVAGGYGESSRIRIKWTRALLNAALDGSLDDVIFVEDERFGFEVPTTCEGVPDEILQPRETWSDKTRFDNVANLLAQMFIENFEQYSEGCSEDVLSASPKVLD